MRTRANQYQLFSGSSVRSGEEGSRDNAVVLDSGSSEDDPDNVSHLKVYTEHGRFNDFEQSKEANESGDSSMSGTTSDSGDQASTGSSSGDSARSEASQPVTPSLEVAEGTGSDALDFSDLIRTQDLPYHFDSLQYALHNPENGLVHLEASLEAEDAKVAELKEEQRRVQILLAQARECRREKRHKFNHAKESFELLQERLGISAELWAEYTAFCESLEPKYGSRDGWSVECFEDHGGNYVTWDKKLELFKESAETSLKLSNFRCEAYALQPAESFDSESGPPWKFAHPPGCPGAIERFEVMFWPIESPSSIKEAETTWRQQYPRLYDLATRAFYDPSRPHCNPAGQLLHMLPDPTARLSGGWLFDYRPEPGRCNDPVLSRRWVYRSAHKIDTDGYQCFCGYDNPFIVDDDQSDDLENGEEISTSSDRAVIDDDEPIDLLEVLDLDLDVEMVHQDNCLIFTRVA